MLEVTVKHNALFSGHGFALHFRRTLRIPDDKIIKYKVGPDKVEDGNW